MKNILMIGTGGTIASGQTADGLAPELDPSRLLQDTPRVAQLCRVDCLQLYSLDSTNIRPDHWLGLAGPSGSITTNTTASSSATAPIPWPTRRRP